MKAWVKVWRDGIAPLLSDESLAALRRGLGAGDERLLQGATTSPLPLPWVKDWAVEAACPLGWCGWQGEGLETIVEVEAFFHEMCVKIDKRLGEPAGCRWFINWWDETPRLLAVRELKWEVEREIQLRKGVEHGEADGEGAAADPAGGRGVGHGQVVLRGEHAAGAHL